MKIKKATLRSASLLARAYAYAMQGNAEEAGELMVEAVQDGNLDAIMHGIATSMGMSDEAEYVIVATAFLIFIEVLQEKNVKIREWILNRNTVVQWIIFYLSIVLIILLTAYTGTGGGFAYENF